MEQGNERRQVRPALIGTELQENRIDLRYIGNGGQSCYHTFTNDKNKTGTCL